MPALLTKPGPVLSDVARHLVLPSGITSTAWPSIEARCRTMGVTFDPWQVGLVQGALAKRVDGKYAATVGGVVWSIPRQVGKTFTLGSLLFALCVETPNLLVLWTAHHTRTSGETFRSMQGMAKRPRVAPFVADVRRGSGQEAVLFRNGSRILFGAREQGFGRGFAEVDVIVFDEAQILTEKALDDMVPAANASKQPAGALIFYIGTPPKPSDPGEAFSNKRAKALAGGAEDLFYVELSADPDSDPDDREQWGKANPSYPRRTPVESMLRMRENLVSDDAFRREAEGIWDAEKISGVIPASAWELTGDNMSEPDERVSLGIEVGPDLQYASVVVAGRRSDGNWHISIDEALGGCEWVVPHVRGLLEANPQIRAVVLDAGSPAEALMPALKAAKIRTYSPTVRELGAGCAWVLNGIITGSLKHRRQRELTSAALSAGKRAIGDTGMWVWSRKGAVGDITPIQAATWALIGSQMDKPPRPLRGSSGVYFKSY